MIMSKVINISEEKFKALNIERAKIALDCLWVMSFSNTSMDERLHELDKFVRDVELLSKKGIKQVPALFKKDGS